MRVLGSIASILLVLGEPIDTGHRPAMLESITTKETRYSGTLGGRDPESLKEVRPPERFLASNTVVVLFGDTSVDGLCGVGPIACAIIEDEIGVIALPDPCNYPAEFYATVLCHEKGHTLGWLGTHGA